MTNFCRCWLDLTYCADNPEIVNTVWSNSTGSLSLLFWIHVLRKNYSHIISTFLCRLAIYKARILVLHWKLGGFGLYAVFVWSFGKLVQFLKIFLIFSSNYSFYVLNSILWIYTDIFNHWELLSTRYKRVCYKLFKYNIKLEYPYLIHKHSLECHFLASHFLFFTSQLSFLSGIVFIIAWMYYLNSKTWLYILMSVYMANA